MRPPTKTADGPTPLGQRPVEPPAARATEARPSSPGLDPEVLARGAVRSAPGLVLGPDTTQRLLGTLSAETTPSERQAALRSIKSAPARSIRDSALLLAVLSALDDPKTASLAQAALDRFGPTYDQTLRAGLARLQQRQDLASGRQALRCLLAQKPLDIPYDNRRLTALARGRSSLVETGDSEGIHALIQDHWRVRFDESPKDSAGHKASSAELLDRLVASLGYDGRASLEQAFESGEFRDLALYTNESEDVFGANRAPVPNYAIINRALRENGGDAGLDEKAPQAAAMIRRLDAALLSLPPVEGLVFRGTRMNRERLKHILDSKVMGDPGYTSTSLDVVDGFDFLMRATSSDTHARAFMTIFGRSGRFIPHGHFSREEEVLFPRGTRFKVNHHFEFVDPEDSAKVTNFLFLEELEQRTSPPTS